MTASTAHTFAGWEKVPSRRGGLKSPKCSCGWVGQPQYAAEGMTQFDTHVKTEGA